jgi:hypothetical protein
MIQLLTLYAAAAGVRAPFMPLPTCLLMLAGHLGFLPLEVRFIQTLISRNARVLMSMRIVFRN